MWIRAGQIPELNTGEELQVFNNDIEPSDIIQGKMKNGYLMAAFASFAEVEERVRNLFVSDICTREGMFGVITYMNGIKKQVLVDNYVPCRKQKPFFARGNGNEMWVIVLEKVYAKMKKSY